MRGYFSAIRKTKYLEEIYFQTQKYVDVKVVIVVVVVVVVVVIVVVTIAVVVNAQQIKNYLE